MAMKSESEIRERLAKKTAEFDKYGRKSATIQINAPRALMQLTMDVEESTLKWVLGMLDQKEEKKKS